MAAPAVGIALIEVVGTLKDLEAEGYFFPPGFLPLLEQRDRVGARNVALVFPIMGIYPLDRTQKLMPTIKIEEVICINGNTLVVFHTPGKCWQFRVVSRTGEVFGEEKVYYTADAAQNAGRSWLGLPGI